MDEKIEEDTADLGKLKNLREHYRTKAFRLALGILFIFGVPAGLAVFAGKSMDAAAGGGRRWQVILLSVAFVLSWIILIVLWRKIDQGMRENDRKIKDAMDKRREKGLLRPQK